jgi:hypothetical protein
MIQQHDRLNGMEQIFSAQFAEIQRQQDAQSGRLGSFGGQIAEVVPRVSDRMDQSLNALQASLHQELRNTLQDEMSNFIPAIEKAMSSMLRKTVKDDSPSDFRSTTSFRQLNGQLGSQRMWMNVSTKEHQPVTIQSRDQAMQTIRPGDCSTTASTTPPVSRIPFSKAGPSKYVSKQRSNFFWKTLRLPGIGTFNIKYEKQLQRSPFFSTEVFRTKLTFIPASWSIFPSQMMEINLIMVHDVTKKRQLESILPRVEFYPTVPPDSPQARCALAGDVDSWMELIRAGKASLRDRIYGFPLLDVIPSPAHLTVHII